MIRRILSHWTHTILICLLTAVLGFVLLPLLRKEPESLHKFFGDLPSWIGSFFILFCCVVFAFAALKLFAPRYKQLKYWKSHPPSWCGFLAGLFSVFLVDVNGGVGAKIYDPTVWEWSGYAGGSFIFALVGRWLSKPEDDSIFPIQALNWLHANIRKRKQKSDGQSETQSKPEQTFTLHNAASAPWDQIEAWMVNESLSEHDFYDHRPIANRLAGLLTDRTRSIGLVGPFGSGKSTIVNWIKENSEKYRQANDVELLISEHSCWGFKTSSASIQAMLSDAIAKVQNEIDTLRIRSLPDSYRKTFSAGGKWIDSISNILLGQTDPDKQFKRLSELMKDIDARLVFVVDDLDRNNSSSFDIQEVLAFLHQLKQYDNISFILSAGLSDTLKIDFAKLCDHVEYLPFVDVKQAADLVYRTRCRCLNTIHFKHYVLTEDRYLWDKVPHLLENDYGKMWVPQAVAVLLNTPRSMRHVIWRTYSVWENIHGEVDWDHLLILSTLRHAAPEACNFLFANWNQLRVPPHDSSQTAGIKKRLNESWEVVSKYSEWNSVAAQKLIEALLPASEAWFGEKAGRVGPKQGVSRQKYWLRATREYVIEQVKDQEICRDVELWRESKDANANLIKQICASKEYCDVLEYLIPKSTAMVSTEVLLLCRQVIESKVGDEGAAGGRGFAITAMREFVSNRVARDEAVLEWLKELIDFAVRRSLPLAFDLWCGWAADRDAPVVRREESVAVRAYLIDELRRHHTVYETLVETMQPDNPNVLSQVFNGFRMKQPSLEGVIVELDWLFKIVLQGVRQGNKLLIENVAILVCTRSSNLIDGSSSWSFNEKISKSFFNEESSEVVSILQESATNGELKDLENGLVEKAILELTD